MELILWRHAEAEEGGIDLPDHKRRLTTRGEKQAKQVAAWLVRHLPRKRRILVSPSERTQQTAHALEFAYEIEPKVGVGATASEVLKAVRWTETTGTVIVIGHQPTLGHVASLLLAGAEADWSVKKGGLWWFSSRKRDDQSETILRAVVNPDMVSW